MEIEKGQKQKRRHRKKKGKKKNDEKPKMNHINTSITYKFPKISSENADFQTE